MAMTLSRAGYQKFEGCVSISYDPSESIREAYRSVTRMICKYRAQCTEIHYDFVQKFGIGLKAVATLRARRKISLITTDLNGINVE